MTAPDGHRTMLGDRECDVLGFLSPTEATVAGIWSELLEQSDIGPEDDFFELGGDSLLAVWLIEEIAERTGRDLPLSLLLEGATIRHLACALDAQGPQPGVWRGINVHGTRCPLFWIHGWAELLSMRRLLRRRPAGISDPGALSTALAGQAASRGLCSPLCG